MKFFNLIGKKSTNVNFFELSAEKKKKIVKRAARGSNELQKELIDQFESMLVVAPN